MTPLEFLYGTIALTAISLAANLLLVRRRRRRLQALARSLELHFSPLDRFHLASKIVGIFPTPGVAELSVSDVMYGQDGGLQQYVFLTHYSAGAMRTKRRRSCVAAFEEPRHASSQSSTPRIVVTPREGTFVDQFTAAMHALRKTQPSTPTPP
jgi:hypothetical protein